MEPSDSDYSLRYTDIPLLKRIQNANSTNATLKMAPHLDEVLLSILLEEMPEPDVDYWNNYKPILGLGNTINLGNAGTPIGIVQMSSVAYNFITCGGEFGPVKVAAYIRPFDTVVWIALISAVGLSIVLLYLTVYISEFSYQMSYSSILLSITAMLLSTIVSTNELLRNNHLRIFFATWLLTSIILSNGYKGDNLADTLAPNEILKLQSVLQLKNFKLLSKRISSNNYKANHHMYYQSTEVGDKMVSLLMKSLKSKGFTKFWKEFAEQNNSQNYTGFLDKYDFKFKQDKDIISVMLQIEPASSKPQQFNASDIRKLLGRCNRTAYLGKEAEITKLIGNFSKLCEKSNVYAGKDLYFKQSSTWYVQESGGYFLKRRLRYVEESGIYYYWKRWLAPHKNSCRNGDRSKISLQSLVYILFCLYVAAGITFVGELVRQRCVIA
ncbi:unnamed protein product [Orchesella dallaii]|uniref:Uncharacterized protein n=1 Tax=Orchesella dallaii TaxID=48710 RepID=A0ABP1S9M6_9HEXA